MKIKHILIICLMPLLIASGCAWFEPKKEKTAEELANEGMAAFAKENYTAAIESFEKLKNWYPFSKFATLAELKTADAHYELEAYEEAVFAYESFENLHPRNQAVPYVVYQIGICHFKRMETIDRDQTATQKAIDVFNRLIEQFPGDVHSVRAKEHIRKCRQNLAEHEFYVGIFYYKSRHYKAAIERFETVISDYPDAGKTFQDAQQYALKCKNLLKE
jgi:outer membrane protein assembly factor BamD